MGNAADLNRFEIDLATHLTGQVVNSTRRSRSDSRGDRIRMHQPHDRSQGRSWRNRVLVSTLMI